MCGDYLAEQNMFSKTCVHERSEGDLSITYKYKSCVGRTSQPTNYSQHNSFSPLPFPQDELVIHRLSLYMHHFHQGKFLFGLNLLGNKRVSDSDGPLTVFTINRFYRQQVLQQTERFLYTQ